MVLVLSAFYPSSELLVIGGLFYEVYMDGCELLDTLDFVVEVSTDRLGS